MVRASAPLTKPLPRRSVRLRRCSERPFEGRWIAAEGTSNPPLVERILSNFRVATVSDERRAELLSGQLENDVTAGDDDLAGVLGATAGGAGTSDIPQGVPAKEIPAKSASKDDARREQLEQAKRAREEIARIQAEEARRRLEVARSEEAAAIARATEAEAHAVRSRTACDQARERLR